MARQIGLSKLYYAVVQTDVPGEIPTFGTPTEIPQVIEISTSEQTSDYTFYSNDMVEESGTMFTQEDVTIELGYIDNKLKAAITGNIYDPETGAYIKSVGAVAPNIALLYEITKSNGASDYKILYNCKLNIKEQKNRTKEDGLESANPQLAGFATPLASLRIPSVEFSSDDEAVNEEFVSNFFKNVFVPTL